MRSALLIAVMAFTATACASSPRGVGNDSPPPPPPPDTVQAPPTATVGAASPRDSAQLRVAGSSVAVSYGRPYMRGRQIFGGLVPFDQVWRTGANEATSFRTNATLDVNGVQIPAGEYTLYSLIRGPSTGNVSEWTLIVNRQTGQWGTQYDASRDLVRIPMTVTQLDRPVEQFTIRVIENGSAQRTGRLVMMWERTQATLDFRVVS
jgi:hypothetical protein